MTSSSWRDLADESITRHEGFRAKPYRDTMGIETIGYGRNLQAKGITVIEARYLMDHDLDEAARTLDAVYPDWVKLSDSRRAALADLTFDLEHKVADFHALLAALSAGRWADAAAALLDSAFARECPGRAADLAKMICGD